MKMRKGISFLMLAVLLLTLLTGCGQQTPGETRQPEAKERISISMYMWDRSMFKQLSTFLEQKFPNIDFTFVQSYNTMEYYKDLLARGEQMPDIITCRRFSLNDAKDLAPYLMDLSQTEVAGTFYSSYLEVNRETGGAIRWLPMCAEVDGILANKSIFDAVGIALPTNYAEFVAAIDALEAQGIRGFRNDWKYDYTCLETMQGCAAVDLMSLEGTQWRMAYESETDEQQVGLDAVVWPRVFAKFEQFMKDVKVRPGEETTSYNDAAWPFRQGEVAMMRGTVSIADSISEERSESIVMLPYFGETAQDNWLLTYPMCQLAVSRSVEDNPAKKAAIMEVLLAIFSQEGQKATAAGTSVLSYNKDVSIELSPSMAYVQDCISTNHLYVRLASTEIFAVSLDVGQKMLKGEYGAQEAYEDFNAQLVAYRNPEVEELLFVQDAAYSNDFTDKGSQAASSLMNTLRVANEEQIAIGYGSIASSSIFAGDYTMQQMKWIMTSKLDAYSGVYTGAEVRRIMEWLVNVKEDGSNPVRHRNQIPVTSGMAYTVRETERGKFELGEITVDGKPLDDSAEYTVLLVGADTYQEDKAFCNCPMPQDLKEKRQGQYKYTNHDGIRVAIAKVGRLLPPTDYLTILH